MLRFAKLLPIVVLLGGTVACDHPKEMIAAGGQSRMPDYSGTMTVAQLVDTVAFLQSRYTIERPMARPAYR